VTPEEQGEVYRNLRSGAESGWDFTSRWMDPVMVDGQPTYLLENIVITSIVPVELNAILYRCERNLARMAQMLVDGTNTLPADDDAVLTSAEALPFVQVSCRGCAALENVSKQ
jgi:neutral trehalase